MFNDYVSEKAHTSRTFLPINAKSTYKDGLVMYKRCPSLFSVSKFCSLELKDTQALLSTYQEAGHFSSLRRGVALSLAQPSAVPHKPEGCTAGPGWLANPHKQVLRAEMTSYSQAWEDQTGRTDCHT